MVSDYVLVLVYYTLYSSRWTMIIKDCAISLSVSCRLLTAEARVLSQSGLRVFCAR
jgi:hypothetical protein